jgi:hypothetical protein
MTFAHASWRSDAARIVESLFPAAPSETWNLLLDLREGLLRGGRWDRTLDVFLACRDRLEADQYLPFFRLRRLLSASLKLEADLGTIPVEVAALADVLRAPHRSFASIRKAVGRELFEHALHSGPPSSIPLRVVERA